MRRMATPLVSEINITPLTDVMLVLLIIFMIASPFLKTQEKEGEELRVPKVETAVPLGEAEHLLVIQKDGSLVLDDQPITREELSPTLLQWAQQLKDAGEPEGLKLYIAADEDVSWRELADIMSIAKRSSVERLAMVQELMTGEKPPEPAPPPAEENGNP